jgi:hypothetical protein
MTSEQIGTGEAWWISTQEFLPDVGEKVLGICKFGHVSNMMFTNHGLDQPCSFSPDGYEPHKDVKWWMPIPTDGWNNVKESLPEDGQIVLGMGMYGNIFSFIYKKPFYSDNFEFTPFVWKVLFWRPMPKLPDGVTLKF